MQVANLEIFKTLVTELEKQVTQRVINELEFSTTNHSYSFAPRNNSYASGCIINLPPFLDLNICEKVLNFVIDTFQVNIVLIIDQERLISSLHQRGFDPIHLGKSGGVVPLE